MKMMDPSGETAAAQCVSTSSTLGYAWQIPYMVVASIAVFTAPAIVSGITAALFLFFVIGGELLYGRKRAG